MQDLSRREFVKLGVMGSACLTLGIPVSANESAALFLHPLIHVADDGSIIIFAQNPEMGQGVKTSLPMMIAEELDVDWANIVVKQADWIRDSKNQFSGGSLSMRLNFTAMRQAGASVREMLLRAAAMRWQVSVKELTTDFRIFGKPVKDVDLNRILTGVQDYSIDLLLPDMLYAVVRRSPDSDGQPVSFDNSKAKKVSGVLDFILLRNDQYGGRIILPNSPNFVSGVAVVAEHTWAAIFNGEITVKDGVVEQGNFHDCPILKIAQVPDINIEFIDSEEAPRGLGEPPLPPVAPAICNAIFAATGKRIRELPLKKYYSV